MAEQYYLAAFIAVSAGATFATRVVPFLFFERHTEHPLVKHIGRFLPAAVMALLAVIFLQRSANWSASAARVGRLSSRVAGGHHSLVAA